MIRDYDSGSDSEGEEVEKLSFPYEKHAQKSTMFHSILSSCKKKFKHPLVRLLDGVDDRDGMGGFYDFENEICEKFGYNQSARIFVKLIESWKKYIDKYIFYPKGDHPLHAIDFLHCLVLGDYGTIDYRKSALNLIVEQKLSVDDKIKIACLHCLRDEIIKLAKAGSIPQQLSGKVYKKTGRIMQFWKTYLLEGKYSGDIEEIIKLVGYCNRDALLFFWDKLTDTQKSRVIVDIFRHTRIELQAQWLHDATKEEQQFIMRKCGGYVLINLMESEQWSNKFFQTAIFSRYLLSGKHYYEVIKAASADISVAKSGGGNKLPLKAFHFIWKQAPKHVRDYIYQQEGALDFFWYVKRRRDYGFFKRIFTQAPMSFKKKFLERRDGMETLSYIYTEDDYPDLFHYLVNTAFPLEQDAVDFKIKFMSEEYGNYIIDNVVGQKDREPFEEALREMFFTDEAMNKFKRCYLYNSKAAYELGKKARFSFYADERRGKFRSKLVFRHIIDYVRWFLPEEEIESFKKTGLCQNKYVKSEFIELIEIGRYNLVDRFLRWSMSNEQLIVEYKRNFFADDLKYEFIDLIRNFVMKKNSLGKLTKFDNWCNMLPENRRKLGDLILRNVAEMTPLWRYMLYEEHFDMATNFLKFCGKSTEDEIKKAKNQLLRNINMIYILHGVGHRREIDEDHNKKPKVQAKLIAKADKIFDWFKPITGLTYLLLEHREVKQQYHEMKNFVKIMSYLK